MKERNLQKLYRDQHIPGNYLREYSQYLFHLLANLDFEIIENIANLIIRQAKKGKVVYLIGNGGSATTASHFATDLVHCGIIGHKSIIRAISLADNVSLITALGNDKGYDQIFAQQLSSLARKGDVLISISASGNSQNLVEAFAVAKKRGMYTVGLVGFDGGKIGKLADYVVQVKTEKGEYGPVEDIHLFLDHMLTSFIALTLQTKNGDGKTGRK